MIAVSALCAAVLCNQAVTSMMGEQLGQGFCRAAEGRQASCALQNPGVEAREDNNNVACGHAGDAAALQGPLLPRFLGGQPGGGGDGYGPLPQCAPNAAHRPAPYPTNRAEQEANGQEQVGRHQLHALDYAVGNGAAGPPEAGNDAMCAKCCAPPCSLPY